MATSIQAKIAPLPRGDYSSSATYAKLDVVSYNGSSYMAIKAVPTGTAPTNTTYWQLLAATATIPDGSISTSKLADGAVTLAKLDSSVSDKYAEVSGTYEDMVVGSAEQLLSTQYDTDSVPYAFRKSPYGDREFDEIVGGSVAWNQWVVNGNFADTSNWSKSGVTMTVSGNVATLTSSSSGDHYSEQSYQNQIPVGHKVIYSTDVKVDSMPSGESSVLALSFFYGYAGYRDTYYATDTNWHTIAKVKNIEPTSGSNPRLVALRLESRKSTVTAQFRNAQLFDLTQMFGTSVADYIYGLETNYAGDGVAFFRGLFPKSYYAYNTGELISVSGLSAHKMIGFNQLSLEGGKGTLSGYANTTPRAFEYDKYYIGLTANNYYKESTVSSYHVDSTTREVTATSSANGYGVAFPIRVLANTNYYVTATGARGNGQIRMGYYDENGVLISYSPANVIGHVVTTPVNCKTMLVVISTISAPETFTLNNICINISGERNGEYEPYESHSYALDSSLTLRGVPKLVDNKVQFDGDIYSSDGTVERKYGIIDLGTMPWTYYQDGLFYSNGVGSIDTLAKNDSGIVCPLYVSQSVPLSGGTNMTAYNMANGIYSILRIVNRSYSDAQSFKTAMSGVMLVYELKTPTTESAEPYVNPQICNEYGTEEYISAEQSGVTMIVGHNTKYPQNLRKKIEGLPWNFSSLIAPTEVTNKATRNYTVGSFLIMNNTLYKVTSAIANGGTITVGSNVTATTIMQEILAL